MSPFPLHRPRRLRENAAIRSLVRETELTVKNLVYPLFVTHGENIHRPIPSMPGIFQLSVDRLEQEINEIVALEIPAVILFGIPSSKDAVGSGSYSQNSVVCQAVQAIKKIYPSLLVITDVCLCEYTDHGHCGVVHSTPSGYSIDNDATLELLSKMAGAHARAGADIIAPSDMMDGRVQAIRDELDAVGYKQIPILSYAVKYASSFYGPFREAAESVPQFGDRRSYQMDPPNLREAVREATLDLEEGADILMVKPALPYLDVIYALKQRFSAPLAAYQVSGEYAMIKAAAEKGWLDEEKAVLESLISIKRAGADFILTYFAKYAARILRR